MWSNLKDDTEYWVNGCAQVFQNLTARCLGWQTVESLQEHLKSCWEAGSLHNCWVFFLFAKAAWWEALETRTAGLYKPATQAIACSPPGQAFTDLKCLSWFSLSVLLFIYFSQQSFSDKMQNDVHKPNYIYRQTIPIPEDTPKVRGYDFNRGVDHQALLQSFYNTGFQATSFGLAVNQINMMVRRMGSSLKVLHSSCMPSKQKTKPNKVFVPLLSTDREAQGSSGRRQ